MSDVQLQTKLVAITECKLGQQILDREWWAELEGPLGWKLLSFTGRVSAEFYIVELEGVGWDGLATVTGLMRDSLLYALCLCDHDPAGIRSDSVIRVPLGVVLEFPTN